MHAAVEQYRDAEAGGAIGIAGPNPSGEEKCLDELHDDEDMPRRRRSGAGGCDRSGCGARSCDAHPAAQPEGHASRACWPLRRSVAIIANALFLQAGRIPRRCSARSSRCRRRPSCRSQPVAASAPGRRPTRSEATPAENEGPGVQDCRDKAGRGEGAEPKDLGSQKRRSLGQSWSRRPARRRPRRPQFVRPPARSRCPLVTTACRVPAARAAWRQCSARSPNMAMAS